jgi:hypothetical protein
MKSSTAIFIRILFLSILLLSISACDKLQKMYESRNDDELAKNKYMLCQEIPQIGAVCNLRTSWREGKLYYIFTAAPLIDPQESFDNKPSDFIDKAIASRSFARSLGYVFGRPTFTAKLVDKAGFEILSIEMIDTLRIVDETNKATSLQQKSSIECSRQKYQDIASWEIAWRY